MFKKPFSTIGTRRLGNSQLSLGGSRQDFDQIPDQENNEGFVKNNNIASAEEATENHHQEPEVLDNSNEVILDPISTLQFDYSRPLEEELWFHGVLPRGEVVRLLATDGDFLVRETTRNDEKQVVLSVMWAAP